MKPLPLTFLEASRGTQLSKTYSQDGIKSYPLVRDFKSHHHSKSDPTLEGLTRRHRWMAEHAAKGHAMLRGELSEPLDFESRAGKSDKDALSNTLVLDVDGLTMPEAMLARGGGYTREDVILIAETAVSNLPKEFHNVSYIAQASNSFGLKKDKVSVHLDFLLAEPIAPRRIKQLLRWMNFATEYYEDRITLNPSGMSLSFVLDPTTADNSRIIYIAPPLVEPPLADPFPNPEDRLILVERDTHCVSLDKMFEDVNPQIIDQQCQKKIRSLRRRLGMPLKKNKTTQVRTSPTNLVTVISNPDRANIEIVQKEGDYLRCDINGGDSHAYYINIRTPHIVYNFKDEEPFLLTEADPELYADILAKYPDTVGTTEQGTKPFVFRDILTDTHWAGQVDVATGRVAAVNDLRAHHIKDYFADYGHVPPDVMPQVEYRFAPNDDRGYAPLDRFVNRFSPTEYLDRPGDLPSEYDGITLGDAAMLKELCPSIYKVIFSMVGAVDEELEYFINWFAYIVQKRTKTGTAYILHGTSGTGKGLFHTHIAAPLLGKKYVFNLSLSNLLDMSNLWAATSLLVLIDEFRMGDFTQESRINNTLKRLITEDRISIRAMRKDFVEMDTFTSFIFASNDTDLIEIPEGDRRFNVCPAQQTKLFTRYPELRFDPTAKLDKELPAFAAFLDTWRIDEQAATSVRETEAKDRLRQSAMKTHDTFLQAVRLGDLDYFMDFLHEQPITDKEIALKIPYDNIMKKAVQTVGITKASPAAAMIEEHLLPLTDLCIMYARIFGKEVHARSMAKMLDRHRIPSHRGRVSGTVRMHVKVPWSLAHYAYEDVVKTVLSDTEYNNLALRQLN